MSNKTKLTGDNYPHTKMMTLSEWKKFRGNFESKEECKQYLLDSKSFNFLSFIMGAFGWFDSKQKRKKDEWHDHNYWGKIAGRKKPVS